MNIMTPVRDIRSANGSAPAWLRRFKAALPPALIAMLAIPGVISAAYGMHRPAPSAPCHSSGGQLLDHPERLGGPWESWDPRTQSAEGMALVIDTMHPDHQPDALAIAVDLYHRHQSRTKWSPLGIAFLKIDGNSGQLRLMGQALDSGHDRINLDLAYVPGAPAWSGVVAQNGVSHPVRFLRPAPGPFLAGRRFVGTWTAPAGALKRPGHPVTQAVGFQVHLTQGADGTWFAWEDSILGGFGTSCVEGRYGLPLSVVHVDHNWISLVRSIAPPGAATEMLMGDNMYPIIGKLSLTRQGDLAHWTSSDLTLDYKPDILLRRSHPPHRN